MPFERTDKQTEAGNLMGDVQHSLLVGGSRSGKTTIIVRQIILRAMKTPSRHLIARFRFNHVKQSIWYDTFPKVMRICFPGVRYKENKSDWFIKVPCSGGGFSEIWFGGIDDADRVEKILGTEFSTIFLSEISQISYDAVGMIRTRLAENTGLKLRFFYDANPPAQKHWAYQEFILGLIPGSEEKTTLDCGCLTMNPGDNIENLPDTYIQTLNALPKRQRERFLLGLWLKEIEGALWTEQWIDQALHRPFGTIIQTVVAVDPAVTNLEGSDETGIIVASIDENREAVIHEDLSIKASTQTWATRAVNAYHKWEAAAIVVEVNQGGDLVRDVIKSIDTSVRVVDVRASKGKFARAEPVAALYEQGKVSHEKSLQKLEAQMTEWVPMNSKGSPDRIDALVWAIFWLVLRHKQHNIRQL